MSILAKLLEPHDAASFLREHWQRRALYIQGAIDKWRTWYAPDRWGWVEHALELEAAIARDGVQHQSRIEPAAIREHFDDGHTICANLSADPALAPLLARFGAELGLAGTPFAKIYASPDGGGFALHLDMFHVFVLQLSGKKHWRFSREPAVVAPICAGKLAANGAPVWSFPHDGEPIHDDAGNPVAAPRALDDVVLGAGDCLYLPPGTWHVASAIEHSLALSLSPPRTPTFQLIARTIEDHLMQQEALRRDVFAIDPMIDGRAPASVAQQFDDAVAAMRELLDGLDRRALHRVWRLNVPAPSLPEHQQASVTLNDMLEHASAELTRYLVAPERPRGPDAIFFYASGSEWSLPIEALRFVEELAKTERFSARAACRWDPALDWSDVRAMLEQLLAAGLLRRA